MNKVGGFSLIEVMIASSILLTSATATIVFNKRMMDFQIKRFHVETAARLAREKIQDLHDFQSLHGQNGLRGKSSYSQIASNKGGVLPAGAVNLQPYGIKTNILTFTRSWEVVNNPKGKSVTVKISWQANGSETQHFALKTFIAPIPPHRRIHLTENYFSE